mmetsp:Transcript_1072/g.2725  ORF Transcript_1072/g.2725 Transcript_1072/m.2725 type:complete len:311 (+) Transcript_1072:715-1647(+)
MALQALQGPRHHEVVQGHDRDGQVLQHPDRQHRRHLQGVQRDRRKADQGPGQRPLRGVRRRQVLGSVGQKVLPQSPHGRERLFSRCHCDARDPLLHGRHEHQWRRRGPEGGRVRARRPVQRGRGGGRHPRQQPPRGQLPLGLRRVRPRLGPGRRALPHSGEHQVRRLGEGGHRRGRQALSPPRSAAARVSLSLSLSPRGAPGRPAVGGLPPPRSSFSSILLDPFRCFLRLLRPTPQMTWYGVGAQAGASTAVPCARRLRPRVAGYFSRPGFHQPSTPEARHAALLPADPCVILSGRELRKEPDYSRGSLE